MKEKGPYRYVSERMGTVAGALAGSLAGAPSVPSYGDLSGEERTRARRRAMLLGALGAVRRVEGAAAAAGEHARKGASLLSGFSGFKPFAPENMGRTSAGFGAGAGLLAGAAAGGLAGGISGRGFWRGALMGGTLGGAAGGAYGGTLGKEHFDKLMSRVQGKTLENWKRDNPRLSSMPFAEDVARHRIRRRIESATVGDIWKSVRERRNR